ncbi:hypothetical protein QBC47DRAFT_392834 [Echria macrotheca]|uniref:DUF6604 domain-containing protein n=1 Tax=Echria macrotheca TaxID=438768 RepID=A0AAJ0B463_9PEZI|nr:hypothetical protein QBC47DRAFT_392834 [Echria macrotheca]
MAQLTNTYQQYKADTRIFASWLATTAKANGWSKHADPSPSSDTPLQTTGVERKQDGRKKDDKTNKDTASVPRNYTVPIEDFVPMATLLATKGKSARLPASLASTLDRVIRLREAFSQLLYQRGAVESDETTARNHSYFVDILKQVREILGGGNQNDKSSESAEASSPLESLSTAFAALHLYEPRQSFLDAPDVAVAGPQYEIAEDEAGLEEDAQVAFAALLQDTLMLRDQVNKLWRARYMQRTLHLAAAAIATNTAIDLVRKMEEEAASGLNRFGGVSKFLIDHYQAAASVEGLDPEHRVADGDDINVDAYEISRRTMFEAYHLLDQFRQACSDAGAGGIPPLYNGQPYGWYDADKAQKCRSTRDKYNRDGAGFSEVLSETSILASQLKWSNVQDEFTRGLRLIMADPASPIPFWTIFAAQLFIDNLEILGGSGWGCVFADATNIGRWTTHRLGLTLGELEGKPRPSGWPVRNDGKLRRLKQDAHFFQTEVISKCKRRMLPSIARPESILLKRNAGFAGVWSHHLLTLFHTTGIDFSNAWGAIFAMAQLNTAVMRLSFEQTRRRPEVMWTDMLIMEHMQGGAQRFWVGSPPKHNADFWKHWCLCQGVSLSEFNAANGIMPIPKVDNANVRKGLVQLAPACLLFRGRLGTDAAGHAARINMALEDIHKIVGEGEWIETEPAPGNVFEMVHEYDTVASRPFRRRGDSNNRKRGRRRPNASGRTDDHLTLSPADLIGTLANTLHGEMAELHFDYFSLHDKCWRLLRDFKRIMDALFRKACEGRPDYVESEDQLPVLVGIVFRAAAGKAPGLPVVERLELLDAVREGLRWLLDRGMNELVVSELRKLGVPMDLEFE